MKKNLTIPEYMFDKNLNRFRRDEWSLLLQVAELDEIPFYPDTLNRVPCKYFAWTKNTLRQLESCGVITKKSEDSFDCNLKQIKALVQKFESVGHFGLKARQMPLVKLAFYVQGQGDYYCMPDQDSEDKELKDNRKYINGEMIKGEFVDLFTVFEKEGDKYLILKKKALDIIDVYKSADTYIKTCKTGLQKKYYASSAFQNIWNTPILGDR